MKLLLGRAGEPLINMSRRAVVERRAPAGETPPFVRGRHQMMIMRARGRRPRQGRERRRRRHVAGFLGIDHPPQQSVQQDLGSRAFFGLYYFVGIEVGEVRRGRSERRDVGIVRGGVLGRARARLPREGDRHVDVAVVDSEGRV